MTLLRLPDIEYEIKNVFTLYFWDIGFWATMLFDASYKKVTTNMEVCWTEE